MFVVDNWTTLAANDFADAIGYHNHHRDVTLKVVVGELENIQPQLSPEYALEFLPYTTWEWDSKLRGGKGQFIKSEPTLDGYISNKQIKIRLTKDSPSLFLNSSSIHTVKQLSRFTAWYVSESGHSTDDLTRTWSRRNLSNWHNEGDWYIPMSTPELKKLWKNVKGLM